MKKVQKIFLSVGILLLILFGCSNNKNINQQPAKENEKIQIVTSIFPVYEIVKELAGDQADVSLMVGQNEDAHHYEPNAQAVNAVNEADLFIYSSKQMEFWVDKLLNVVENEDLQIIELIETENLDLDHEDSASNPGHSHDHGDFDPHFWVDPIAVKNQLPRLKDSLSSVDPDGEVTYQKNMDEFTAALEQLDQQFNEAFEDATHRTFVVQHQSFGHLAERYRLEQVAVGGLVTEVEPDPKSLINTVNFIREQNVPIIYYQSGEKSSIAEAIAKETNTEIEILYDLENKPIDIEDVDNIYLEAMYQNLEKLKKSIY